MIRFNPVAEYITERKVGHTTANSCQKNPFKTEAESYKLEKIAKVLHSSRTYQHLNAGFSKSKQLLMEIHNLLIYFRSGQPKYPGNASEITVKYFVENGPPSELESLIRE